MTEQELAKHIIEWLEERDWEVYQEVSSGDLCPVADIVAVRNGLTWIIETKTTYGLAVINQACHWLSRFSANYISVAVLKTKKRKGAASWYFHKEKGIGLMQVDSGGYVSPSHEPKLIRVKKESMNNIKNMICEQHKHYAEAGAKGGGYYTPFKETVRQIEKYVKMHPGTTIKEMVEYVGGFHYASNNSAKNCISKYIREGVIKTIETRQDGRKQRLYLRSEN